MRNTSPRLIWGLVAVAGLIVIATAVNYFVTGSTFALVLLVLAVVLLGVGVVRAVRAG